jgi:hypothetical protein
MPVLNNRLGHEPPLSEDKSGPFAFSRVFNRHTLLLGGREEAAPLFRLESGAASLEARLGPMTFGEPYLKDNRVLFPFARGIAEFAPEEAHLKETFLFTSRPSGDAVRYSFNYDGLQLHEERGTFVFCHLKTKEPLFWLESPSAHDARGKPLLLKLQLLKNSPGLLEFQIAFDSESLDTASLPITLDPTISASQETAASEILGPPPNRSFLHANAAGALFFRDAELERWKAVGDVFSQLSGDIVGARNLSAMADGANLRAAYVKQVAANDYRLFSALMTWNGSEWTLTSETDVSGSLLSSYAGTTCSLIKAGSTYFACISETEGTQEVRVFRTIAPDAGPWTPVTPLANETYGILVNHGSDAFLITQGGTQFRCYKWNSGASLFVEQDAAARPSSGLTAAGQNVCALSDGAKLLLVYRYGAGAQIQIRLASFDPVNSVWQPHQLLASALSGQDLFHPHLGRVGDDLAACWIQKVTPSHFAVCAKRRLSGAWDADASILAPGGDDEGQAVRQFPKLSFSQPAAENVPILYVAGSSPPYALRYALLPFGSKRGFTPASRPRRHFPKKRRRR